MKKEKRMPLKINVDCDLGYKKLMAKKIFSFVIGTFVGIA